jgi:hypothetical protein
MDETTNVYLWEVDGMVIYHTDLQAAADLDGLTREPDKTVTTEQWNAAEGIARIIDNEIELGKTDEEIEKENLMIEEQELLKELADKDYKVVKASEIGNILADTDPDLHERRDWCRNRINEIKEILG